MNTTVVAEHVLYPKMSETVPGLEYDIERLADAQNTVIVYLASGDAGDDPCKPSAAQDEVYNALQAARVKLTHRLVRMTATPTAPWYVTDECGELKATVVYADEAGFHLVYQSGKRDVLPYLDHDGPWDGQDYTITRELAPASKREAA